MAPRTFVLAVSAILCTFPCNLAGVEGPSAPKPRILFLGLWDRAFQQMAKASAETGIPVQMRGMTTADTPAGVQAAVAGQDYAAFDLIYVLQIDQVEAHALVDLLRNAKKTNPQLRVIQLDRRATQQELIDEGILEVSPQVTAYWRNFGMENLKRLLVYSQVTYLGGSGEILPPIPVASAGLYHPDATGFFATWADYCSWYRKRSGHQQERPLVAMFIQQDYVTYGNTHVYDALIRALESRQTDVAPMFGNTQELQAFLREYKPSLLVLQHHQGPEDTPPAGKKPFLEELGVPYLYAAGMMSNTTVKQWQEDVRGVRLAGYGQLSRHELYGIIEPFLIGAKGNSAYGFALDEPIPDRVNRVADRVKGWLALQQTSAADKKVAIIYFHKYLGKADVGRPAPEMSRYLDPHESLVKLLGAMSQAGYHIDPLPSSSQQLLDWMKKGGRNIPNWAAGEMEDLLRDGQPVLVPEKQYAQWYAQKLTPAQRAAVEKAHGPLPGKLMVTEKDDQQYIVIPCLRLGNVVLAPQPDRGTMQDNSLVHSRTEPPPHNYLAFYWWLQEQFGVQAMIHFGTHGSEFYLPGKEIFLSADCFPDTILGSIPNFDIWTIQNVGEAMIAKRRSCGVIVDHGVPPILAVSRDAQADSLLELTDRFAQATTAPVKAAIGGELTDTLRDSPFYAELKLDLADDEVLTADQIEDLSNYLRHVQANNVVQGMHVLGQAPPADKALPFVAHIVARNTDLLKKLQAAGVGKDADEKAQQLLEALLVKNASAADAARELGLPEPLVMEQLAAEIALARKAWDGLGRTGDEITNLLAGLEGRYVPPGPGGDPLLRPDALPTGRNLYGLSPQQIPTRQAWNLAQRVTDGFLAKFKATHGRYPQKLAFSLTGMETFRDTGVMEAQILYLLGVRPEYSPGNLIAGLKVIPAEELKRPRIDVVISVGGIYLKDFPSTVKLLDEAVRLTAACQEEDNIVRQHSRKIREELAKTGVPASQAYDLSLARIFGVGPSSSGARLVWLLPRSGTWQERQEIVDVWREMRTHAYTGAVWGERLPDLHDRVYAGTEGVVANWSDNLLSPLTNHHYPEETGGLAMSVQWITGKRPEISIFDLRQRDNPGAIGLEEVLSLELRSVALNKEWIRGQMEHGYIGATQFMQITDDMFQWEAVREGAIWPGAWEKMVDVYVRDSLGLGLPGWFEKANPFAFQELTATLLEASRKGYWKADPATLRQLAVAHAESVAKFGHGAGPYAGGNQKLRSLLASTLNQPGDEPLVQAYQAKVEAAEKVGGAVKAQSRTDEAVPPSSANQTVTGRKMEQSVEQNQPPAPAETTGGPWLLYAAVVTVGLVLLLIGFRFKLGVPAGK